MPSPITGIVSGKPVSSVDKKAEREVRVFVNKNLPDLEYAHKKLAEDMILAYINSDPSFNGYKATFIKRLKYMLIKLKDPKSYNEVLHLVSQFNQMDRIRRSVGIPLKDVRTVNNPLGNKMEVKQSTDIYNNPSVTSPAGFPIDFNELLQVPSLSGVDYLEYVKNNIDIVIFADFEGTKEFMEYSDTAGVSEPMSRTSIINISTYLYYEKTYAPSWAIASSLVHEAAHIEWDWSHENGPADASPDYAAERYAYIMKYKFLNNLISNAYIYKLEKKVKIIRSNLDGIEYIINECNKRLGYMSGDFSVKVSPK